MLSDVVVMCVFRVEIMGVWFKMELWFLYDDFLFVNELGLFLSIGFFIDLLIF